MLSTFCCKFPFRFSSLVPLRVRVRRAFHVHYRITTSACASVTCVRVHIHDVRDRRLFSAVRTTRSVTTIILLLNNNYNIVKSSNTVFGVCARSAAAAAVSFISITAATAAAGRITYHGGHLGQRYLLLWLLLIRIRCCSRRSRRRFPVVFCFCCFYHSRALSLGRKRRRADNGNDKILDNWNSVFFSLIIHRFYDFQYSVAFSPISFRFVHRLQMKHWRYELTGWRKSVGYQEVVSK